jgi:hypothetical protein
MSLNLIKLCVGVDHVDELQAYYVQRLAQKKAEGQPQELMHVTRMTPKRSDEILDGGSLYWVIKRVIQARQRILELRPLVDNEGKRRCAIVLDPEIILVEPRKHRPFQGWRYLKMQDAPKDFAFGSDADTSDMPASMRAELSELGLI